MTKWNSVETLPRDGRMVRLMISGDTHTLQDDNPWHTIGFFCEGLSTDDARTGWRVVGWCWSHDHFVNMEQVPADVDADDQDGYHYEITGWLPFEEVDD